MTIIDKACYERGCACYDDRVDKDGVAVVAQREVLAEREAAAKMVDHILKPGGGTWGDAIRARGQG